MRAWIIATAFCLINLVSSVWGEPFRDGEVVCFLGDSITKGGEYHGVIRLFYATRFPDRHIRFQNCGVGGDRAEAIVRSAKFRIEADVLAWKPTTVSVMLGMNDVGRKLYGDKIEELEKDPKRWQGFAADYCGRLGLAKVPTSVASARAACLDLYSEKMAGIISQLKRGDARVILMTPSIYDETAVISGGNSEVLTGVNGGLGCCAEKVRQFSKDYQAGLVETYGMMNEINRREQAKSLSFSLVGSGKKWNDRVHPGPVGHFVMAYSFLKSQGMSPYVSKIDLDAATRLATGLVNCTVTGVMREGAGIGFDCREGALPLVPPPKAREALRLVPFTEEFNQQILLVRGLEKGAYELKIDGEVVGHYSADEFRTGVNLATVTNTPQYRQSAKATEIAGQIHEIGEELREIATFKYGFSSRGGDPSDPEAVKKAVLEAVEKAQAGGQRLPPYVKSQRDCVLEPGKLEARRDALEEELRAVCRTMDHRFEIIMKQRDRP
jgi:lysophospholipase L1-like esterase